MIRTTILTTTIAVILITSLSVSSVYALPSTETLYGAVGTSSASDAGAIVTISTINGAQTLVGNAVGPNGLSGIAFDSTGKLFGVKTVRGGGSTPVELVEINPDTGSLISTIGTVTSGGNTIKLPDLAVQPGTDALYGIGFTSSSSSQLYVLDKNTAVATLLGNVPFVDAIGFAPDGTLYGTAIQSGQSIYTLDPNTGAVISSVGITNGYDGLTVRSDGTVFASQRGTDGAAGANIYTLNPITGSETLIGSDVRKISDLAFSPVPADHEDILEQLQEILDELKEIWEAIMGIENTVNSIETTVNNIESNISSSTERVSVTVNLDDIKLKTGEVMVLLDTTNSGTLSTVHVAANLPCNDVGEPQIHVVAGVAGGSLSGVLTDAADNTGFNGPEKTCVFHDNVDADDLGHDITDVIIIHPDNHPDADKKDDKKHEKLKGVVVTITGTYN